jgi:hypothetical protein
MIDCTHGEDADHYTTEAFIFLMKNQKLIVTNNDGWQIAQTQ